MLINLSFILTYNTILFIMIYNPTRSDDFGEEIQSVSYAINVEPSAINYAQNITPLDSSYSYFPTVGSSLINFATNVTALDSHDFEWSASDNASDMNYMSVCNTSCNPLLRLIQIPFVPCIIYREVAQLKSQKLKVTDTHVDFEHLSLPRCYCCLSSNPSTETYHIRLKDIRSISYSKHKQQLDIHYFKPWISREGQLREQSAIQIRGLLESSNTPGLIKDAIVQRRPKPRQTIRYTIPHITNTYKYQTITLNPNHNTVDYKDREKDTVAFIDGLGNVDDDGSRLVFWMRSHDRTLVHAPYGLTCCEIWGNDPLFEEVNVYQPVIVFNFPDERSCSDFKAAAAISQSMDNLSHDFEWSASDNPSEITCLPTCSEIYTSLFICTVFHYFLIMSPCIAYNIYNHWKKVPSQRVKITDTHIDFEHTSPRSCCCLNSESKRTYHINLNDVRMIHNTSRQLRIYYYVGPGKIRQSSIEIRGLVDSSNISGLIKDAIVQRRPKQTQTIPYTIPHITNTHKSHTITLNPHHNTVDYKDKVKETVSFIDGLGSIDMQRSCCLADSRLQFWRNDRLPSPDGKNRPEMFVSFPDDRSCLDFKHAIESSQNSFVPRRLTASERLRQIQSLRSQIQSWRSPPAIKENKVEIIEITRAATVVVFDDDDDNEHNE